MNNNLIKTIFFFLIISINLYGQNVKIKKDIAYVNDKEYLKFENCGAFSDTCSIKNLNNEEIIFITVDKVPRDTRYTYDKVKFLGFDKTIESRESRKDLVKIFYINKVVDENGNLNEDSVNKVVEKYGNDISIKD